MIAIIQVLVLIAFSVLPIEGQGQFIQPPSDNYDLALDPYQAASSFVMICAYEDANTAFDYTWVKDGVRFQPSIQSRSFENGVLATVAVPNGDYLSTLEGNYTCRVSLGGATRASRKIIVSLPVVFSVNMTTVVGTVGETLTVNCSQTGYIRAQWMWWKNGSNIPTSPSERVHAELSARTKVGTATATTVDNHQSLFLHLRHARVMDNGEYTCVTETGIQTVTMDIQPPENCNIRPRFSGDGSVSYEMPQPFENITLSYADFLYNGSEDDEGVLKGGVGQLVDGVKGTMDLDTDEGRFPWVGWATPPQQIIFEFGVLRQFHAVTVHSFFDSPGVTSFGKVEVSISQTKENWKNFSLQTTGSCGPHDVTVVTLMDDGTVVVGRYVLLTFGNFQGSAGPMLISEVSFISSNVVDAALPGCSSLANGLLIVGGVILGTILATPTSILATCRYFKRKQRKTKEESAYADTECDAAAEMEKNPAYTSYECPTDDISCEEYL